MSKIRVLIADDHAILREGIRALLQLQPDIEVVGDAGAAWRRSPRSSGSIRTSSSWTSPCPASAASRRRSS